MQYNFLDRDKKTKVSSICLGTMTWGVQNTEQDAHEQIDYALNQGINFIDTAEIYPVPPSAPTYTLTEQYIGSWMNKNKAKRKDIILASKIVGINMEYIRNGTGINKAGINIAIEDSLKRLNTDYLDLYQLHWPQRKTNYFATYNYNPFLYSESKTKEEEDNILEVLETLGDLVKQGKVKHIGVSNETAWGVIKFCELYKKNTQLPKLDTIQNIYNLISRSFDLNLSEVCLKEKVNLLAYSPLAGGLLSGKYRNNQFPAGARFSTWGFERMARYKNQHALTAVEQYANLAEKNNLDPSQMAIAYILTKPYLGACIIGATTMQQLKIDIDSINVTLSPEIITSIENIFDLYKNPAA